ncbi:MAG: hypothetical protein FWG96_05105 [Methanomassiliicoccaceae archaeon]|nr:hypothetical protein [Methanomassiliicoccaceae archaeon]
MIYSVETKYDDGFESVKEFDDLQKAKSYFQNIDDKEIELSSLKNENGEVIAQKEGRKRK